MLVILNMQSSNLVHLSDALVANLVCTAFRETHLCIIIIINTDKLPMLGIFDVSTDVHTSAVQTL